MMTTRRRKSPEKIVRFLGQADRLLANGHDLPGACRNLAISKLSYCPWQERDAQAVDGRCRGGEGSVEGDRQGKVVSLRAMRAAAHRLIAVLRLSERNASQIMDLPRPARWFSVYGRRLRFCS